jgi:RNA polymerase sigma-70 factor (ECF subfamily)
MLQDADEAAETTQEVFLAAYKNIRSFRRQARFSTWLYRIASNQCISRLRRRPPGVHYSLDDHRPGNSVEHELPTRESHENEVLREESRLQVIQALEILGPDQRAVVELKFYQELTFEEIAAILEEPLSTVKTRLYCGLDLLKNHLSPDRQRIRL